MKIDVEINGRRCALEAEPGERLAPALKRAGLRGIRNGCDGHGSCGACTVLLDGEPVNACLLFAAQVEGRTLRTVEAAGTHHALSPIQSAFVDAGIVQCGYCTPAMVLAVEALLERVSRPTRADVQDALSGVFCRCTGYEQVFGAVELARARRADPTAAAPAIPEFREETRFIGKAHPKVDAPNLARGGAAFVEDMVDADACHLKMLRSPHAHAYIKRIDVSKAEALPGVVMVVTHHNCPDKYYSQAGQGFPEPSPYDRRMFGQKVRHVGDRVAAVLAETPQIAQAALALIDVEYEVLPPVFTVDEAAAEGAPIVHNSAISFIEGGPETIDNSTADPRDGQIVYLFPLHADPHRNLCAAVSGGIGDLAVGFEQADVIVEREFETSQIQCTPLEPHVTYAKIVKGRLVVHASTQVPWHLRRMFSFLLDLPENQIRVIKERTGGAFGAKQDMVLEDVAAWCAWQTGRGVFFRFTREEEFIASRTRHPMKIRVKLGAKQDGTLTAMEMVLRANTGPYGAHGLTVPMNACSKALPVFLCDHVHFDVKSFYSNIPPTGAYQGYGAPQGAFAMQVTAAELATELGMDPLDFIEKNRVREGSVLEILKCLGEGREGRAEKIYSCGLGKALARGREQIGWDRREDSGDPDVKIGKGVAIVQQGSGLPGLDSANATLTMFGDGTFMLLSGGTDLGTGLDTVATKMVAEVLSVPMGSVAIIAADTDATPFDVGAYASSGTFYSGGAALNAARAMKDMVLDVAAEMLGEPREDLELVFPATVRGRARELKYGEIARYTQSGTGRGQLTTTSAFTAENGAFPYATHFCQVAVDTRTGAVTVQRYHAYQDCGTPINPELAVGQTFGGVLKTIGHTLTEEMVLDETGRCLNPNLLDYGVPMIGDLPADFRAEMVYTADPWGPFGAKSVSEIACNAAAPAIAAAIHQATGVWLRSWPFSPEKVLRALGKL